MRIVIEGGDACGKHTQAELLRDRLAAELKLPRYDTPVGAVILKLLKGGLRLVDTANSSSDYSALVLQCLMTIDRYGAVSELHPPGTIFVCDRWWQSGFVYGCSDGLDPWWLESIHTSLPEADLNILLDVPVTTAMARRPVPRDKYEASESKRIDVRNRYLSLWNSMNLSLWKSKQYKKAEAWQMIYGDDSVDSVHQQIWALVKGLVQVPSQVNPQGE
jgi:dTMP kinase